MRRHVVIAAVLILGATAWYGAIRSVMTVHRIVAAMDRAEELAQLTPRPQATIVFDRKGRPAFSYFVEQRIDVPLASVSSHMIEALLSVEDRRFYSHNGIDPVRIAGAAWRNLRARRIVQGGSTITQQLARVSQLTPIRTYERKVRETLIASRLEHRYSKEQILEQYLNTVYFGEGFYGVEAASRGYFTKPASALVPHEAALLAALVRSPSHDAPCAARQRATKRRDLVLRLMHREGKLTADQHAHAVAQPLPECSQRRRAAGVLLAGGKDSGGYFQEELRQQLISAFGNDQVLRGGLRVYSTYDPDMQVAAEQAINSRIAKIAAVRATASDLQGSLVAMDPVTGDVYALVGGRNFAESPYNRATQARRQAGSAFKPIIYAAALERGYAPGTMLKDLDAPIYAGISDRPWLPKGDHERSEYTVRRALSSSSNRAAAHLLQQLGVSSAIYYASRMGIESRLPAVPSLALGTGEVTLLELTTAYTAFANRGVVSAPRLFTRVEDARGTILLDAQPRHTHALNATTAYLMSHMLSDVISRGTASTARAGGFRLPAAGKTGTTDDYTDAWFVGYTPHLVTGVWFGADQPRPIMREGWASVVAVPAWSQFMRVATEGARPDWYEMPAGIEKVSVCSLSGARATDACRHGHATYDPSAALEPAVLTDAAYEPVARPARVTPSHVYEDLFPAGAVPIETCWMHAAAPVPVPPVFTSEGAAAVETPLVDDSLRRYGSMPVGAAGPVPAGTTGSVPVAASGTFPVGTAGTDNAAPSIVETSNGTRISIQRVVGADGIMRTVVRQIR